MPFKCIWHTLLGGASQSYWKTEGAKKGHESQKPRDSGESGKQEWSWTQILNIIILDDYSEI